MKIMDLNDILAQFLTHSWEDNLIFDNFHEELSYLLQDI